MRELASGARGLTSGSRELTSGSRELTSGSRELTSGSQELTSGSREVISDARGLISRSQELTSGSRELISGSRELIAESEARPQQAIAGSRDAEMRALWGTLSCGTTEMSSCGTGSRSSSVAGRALVTERDSCDVEKTSRGSEVSSRDSNASLRDLEASLGARRESTWDGRLALAAAKRLAAQAADGTRGPAAASLRRKNDRSVPGPATIPERKRVHEAIGKIRKG
jgi:putative membrane protein